MAFDGIVIRAIVRELSDLLTKGRINKIYQPNPRDLVFQIRSGGKNHKLLMSANPTYPRIYLTGGSFTNPAEPPMFCMLLRKHCEGAIIEGIRQEGMERIITIETVKRDELGDEQKKQLIIEIMGRHSNIILVDEKQVRSLMEFSMSPLPLAVIGLSFRGALIFHPLPRTKSIRWKGTEKPSSNSLI